MLITPMAHNNKPQTKSFFFNLISLTGDPYIGVSEASIYAGYNFLENSGIHFRTLFIPGGQICTNLINRA
jgi:hypothetical protein